MGTGPGKRLRGLPFCRFISRYCSAHLIPPGCPPHAGDEREATDPCSGTGRHSGPTSLLTGRTPPAPLRPPGWAPALLHTPRQTGPAPSAACRPPGRGGAQCGGGGHWAAAGDGAARCRPSGGGGEGPAPWAPRREGERRAVAVAGLAVESGETAACGLRSRARPRGPFSLRGLFSLRRPSSLRGARLPEGSPPP